MVNKMMRIMESCEWDVIEVCDLSVRMDRRRIWMMCNARFARKIELKIY